MTEKKGARTVSEAFRAQMGKGRPAGLKNRVTTEAKEVIALAAEGLGGVQRLIDWAKEDPENETKFWATIYPRLIPVTVANPEGEAFRVSKVDEDADAFTNRLLSIIATGAAASASGVTEH